MMDIFDAETDKIWPEALAPIVTQQPTRQLHRVGVAMCPQMSLASLGLLLDVFRMGNQLPGPHRFELTRVSEDGASVPHSDGDLRVEGDASLLAGMALVVVPSLWTEGDAAVAGNPRLVAALRDLPERVLVATMCTGAYLLAATGRLNQGQATTHWLLADALQVRFPEVQVRADANLVEQGNLICSGGSMAGVDACLHAVQRLADRDTAKALARMLVTHVSSGAQTQYMPPYGWRRHADREMRRLQAHLESSFALPITLESLAQLVHVSVRTLQRRFLAATGMTPMQYLQAVRIEHSKDLLDTQRLPVPEVAAQVGYQDRVAFGRLFKKTVGMTPAAYRQQQQGLQAGSKKG
jgi:AraC family transcriptional regulator, transcriptional activator FtrA